MSDVTIINFVNKVDDIIDNLESDYKGNNYYPSVYIYETEDQYIIGSGSPTNDNIRIYKFQKGNEGSFEEILERETRNIDIHRVKVYEYLISNYNTINPMLGFEEF